MQFNKKTLILLEKKYGTQKLLAKSLKVSARTIQRWKKADKIGQKSKFLKKLKRRFVKKNYKVRLCLICENENGEIRKINTATMRGEDFEELKEKAISKALKDFKMSKSGEDITVLEIKEIWDEF